MERIRPFIPKQNPEMLRRLMLQPIIVESRLAMTLRYLAGASYLDCMDSHGVSRAAFYASVHVGLRAILSTDLGHEDWPSEDTITNFAQGFAGMSSCSIFDDCVGAVDGLLMNIIVPGRKHTNNTRRFYSGNKKCYGMNLQAVCDSTLRFTASAMNTPGGTNDVTAFEHSQIMARVDSLPPPYFIVGDAAYTLTDQLLTPFSGSSLTQAQDVYNFYLSQLRITIERAFGVFVQRWGIFWGPMRADLDTVTQIVQVCIRLHNFCIDRKDIEASALGNPTPHQRRSNCPVLSSEGTLPSHWATRFSQAPAGISTLRCQKVQHFH